MPYDNWDPERDHKFANHPCRHEREDAYVQAPLQLCMGIDIDEETDISAAMNIN